jgi:hypothetical protein
MFSAKQDSGMASKATKYDISGINYIPLTRNILWGR